MSIPNPSQNPAAPAASFPVLPAATTGESTFVDRRAPASEDANKTDERRQFGSSHTGLTEDGRELAIAIDRYKLANHRRYITCDEMLRVITSLGYSK